PLFPRVTRWSRSGRPCFCRSGISTTADLSLVPFATLPDVLRSVGAMDRAVSAPHACSRNQMSRRHRFLKNVVSSFASTDARKAHLLLEQKELNAGSREQSGAITRVRRAKAKQLRRSLERLVRAHRSLQHRCRFDLDKKFWNCQRRDADPSTCRRILRRKEFS